MEKPISAATLRWREHRARLTSCERREEDKKKIEKRREKTQNLKNHPRLWNQQKAKTRIEKQKYRQKKKDAGNDKPAFTNKNTFGKALGKLNGNLPKSPKQAEGILEHALKLRRSEESDPKLLNGTKKSLSVETIQKVLTFYASDECSRPDPSMNGTIWMTNDAGEKIRTAKRYMLSSGGESHQLFLQKFPANPLSLTKFYELRPKNVRSFIDTPHRTCMCKYHANILFLLESLAEFIPHCENIDTFIDFIVCDQNHIDCMLGKCDACSEFIEKVQNEVREEEMTNQIKWRLWSQGMIMLYTSESHETNFLSIVESEPVVIEQTGTVKEALEILCNQMEKHFKFHHYVKRSQEKAFEDSKAASSEEEVVLQIDFAESYACTTQNETQAAHFSKKTISVFTAVATAGEKTVQMALICDDKRHDTFSVAHYLKVIINLLLLIFTELKRLKIISDGSAAQFKNR